MRRNATVVKVDSGATCVELESIGHCRRCSQTGGCGAVLSSAGTLIKGSGRVRLNISSGHISGPTSGYRFASADSRQNQTVAGMDEATDVDGQYLPHPQIQHLRIGQQVVVDVEEHGSRWLWAVFGAYGLPLVGMLAFTACASFFSVAGADRASGFNDVVIFGSAVLGFCVGLCVWRLCSDQVLALSERSLCLSSARIVSGGDENLAAATNALKSNS